MAVSWAMLEIDDICGKEQVLLSCFDFRSLPAIDPYIQ